jgi:hypothetical protein
LGFNLRSRAEEQQKRGERRGLGYYKHKKAGIKKPASRADRLGVDVGV